MSKPTTVVGKSGQVARALVRLARERRENLCARGRPDLDLTNSASIDAFLNEQAPALVINAAAYTAVDNAESEREQAYAVNAHGPAALAIACAERNIPLIHISTDYVFDGSKAGPYIECDLRKPISVYGTSKAAGEVAVAQHAPRHVIFRTAWVYGTDGTNFAKTMLRLGTEREELGVIDDQHGAPTFADDIASAILKIAPKLISEPEGSNIWGTYHLTNAGSTTWYGFAREIFAHAKQAGLKTPRLKAITTADYPLPARRPRNSVLNCDKVSQAFAIKPDNWNTTLTRAIGPIIERHLASRKP